MRSLVAVFIVATACFYAYRTGTRLSEVRIEALESQIAALGAENTELERANAGQRSDLAAARALAQDLRDRYERDVATGDDKILFDAIRRKLADGVSHERLAFVIGAAQERRECDDPPAAKRFIVTTPLHRGDRASAVGFGNGEVVVTAAGASMRDANGNPEAWFDPAQPVTASVVTLSGQKVEETGVLPLFPALIVDGAEYRLSVLAGPGRGFARVSIQKCRYP